MGAGMAGAALAGVIVALLMADARASTCHAHFSLSDYPSCVQVTPNVTLHWAVGAGSLTWGVDMDGGRTLVEMRRPLASCDPQDHSVLNDTRQTVVFAYGLGDFAYHGPEHRGSKQLVLLPAPTPATNGSAATNGSEVALQVLEMRASNYSVPADPTTYACVNLELPSDKKYHIYKYEPIIDNARLVHHFVAWACSSKPTTPMGVPYDCLGDMECEEFYMEWAPGSGAIVSPPEAAQAFGSGSKVYIALQVHYTNVEGLEGQTDSSGFRVYYSDVLKQYDMGVLTLGTESIAVPAGAESWSTKPNKCPGDCTRKLAPAAGLTLVDSFYHMHAAGKQMVTRHIRNGTELAPLGRRDFFDFAFQGTVNIPPGTRQLLPGDELITTCTYTGVGRTETTFYGPASFDEMCYNYMTYYPENLEIDDCMSLDEVPTQGFGGIATCTKKGELDQLQSEDDFYRFVYAGKLVLLPLANSTIKAAVANPSRMRAGRMAGAALAGVIVALLMVDARASTCNAHFSRSRYPSCVQVTPNVTLHWAVSAGSLTWGVDVDGGRTLVEMRRPLASCDPQDHSVLNDTRQTVVFAYGLGYFAYHGPEHRGSKQLVLLPAPTPATNGSAAANGSEVALQVLEMRISNFSVPAAPTTYTCVNLELPSDKKYHVYKYEPVIDNAHIVHHFVAWACASKPKTALGVPYGCLRDVECTEFYMEWAPGSGTIVSPPEAAQAFGNGSKVYIALQMHYTNLERLQGQTDSSGFRVYYSDILKKYDMGVLTLGTESIAVPAGAESWSTKPNKCPGDCTQQLAPAAGLTLVDSFYHMHAAGKQMITRHIRNGTELAPLGRRDFFDFGFQGTANIPPGTRQLLPGDELITTCTYTGVGRTNVTSYGPASYDEMCYNYLTYYPENPTIKFCMTLDRVPTPGYAGIATCTKQEDLVKLRATADFVSLLQVGKLVLIPSANSTIT
ncbi:DBH-like monooxygenase protein 2 [Tetrabaena socialis]|uniref:DBH-like monooxygenase protein 2 n=1 Tax=Tetrabaena socialis TaxID=47790 RepID=A0A2J8ABI9_9CHLO|nr:DBH-like monooxygenase protein 2 [Tetrabaena socialis]|eukprot:PNH09876.1 DBH-like monooxygenase protein 2 [Tetrabaena socialis]